MSIHLLPVETKSFLLEHTLQSKLKQLLNLKQERLSSYFFNDNLEHSFYSLGTLSSPIFEIKQASLILDKFVFNVENDLKEVFQTNKTITSLNLLNVEDLKALVSPPKYLFDWSDVYRNVQYFLLFTKNNVYFYCYYIDVDEDYHYYLFGSEKSSDFTINKFFEYLFYGQLLVGTLSYVSKSPLEKTYTSLQSIKALYSPYIYENGYYYTPTSSVETKNIQLTSPETTLSFQDPFKINQRCFLVFNYTLQTSQPDYSQISGTLLQDKIIFKTEKSPLTDLNLTYFVIKGFPTHQYPRSISCVSGSVTPLDTAYPKLIDLYEKKDNYFPLITVKTFGEYFGIDDLIKAEILEGKTLKISAAKPAKNRTIEWQVVAIEGTKLYKLPFNVTNTYLSNNYRYHYIRPENCFVVCSHISYSTESKANEMLAMSEIPFYTNSGEVKFVRGKNDTTNDIEGTLYIIYSDRNIFKTQFKSFHFSPNEYTKTVDLNPVLIEKTWCYSTGRFGCYGISDLETSDIADAAFMTKLIPDSVDQSFSSKLEVCRGSAKSFARVIVQVITFTK